MPVLFEIAHKTMCFFLLITQQPSKTEIFWRMLFRPKSPELWPKFVQSLCCWLNALSQWEYWFWVWWGGLAPLPYSVFGAVSVPFSLIFNVADCSYITGQSKPVVLKITWSLTWKITTPDGAGLYEFTACCLDFTLHCSSSACPAGHATICANSQI